NPQGRSQLNAIEQDGVDYLEVRILDLDPYERIGVSQNQLRMLHVFMLFCLFANSPPITNEECRWINENHHMVSSFGRKPNLELQRHDRKKVTLREWAEHLLGKMVQIAK